MIERHEKLGLVLTINATRYSEHIVVLAKEEP